MNDQCVQKEIVIIGTGFGGLGMAMQLKLSGIHDFVIVEKAGDVGGVWRENDYPGAGCDVPSLLYSYSFESTYNWSRTFSPQEEIHSYLKYCVQKYNLRPHIVYHENIIDAFFDDKKGLWNINSSSGKKWKSKIFIAACGQLSQPFTPHIEGMDTFKGKTMHSARWDHRYPLNSKNVAVIGTGASVIQFLPKIVGQVKKLTVFQRSAPYVLPKSERAFTKTERSLFRVLPIIQKLYRLVIYLQYESRFLGFIWKKLANVSIKAYALRHLCQKISDPLLRKKLTPDYDIGCKRILISNEYYEVFNRTHVKLETLPISHLDTDGIILKSGEKVSVDAIIYGTGFNATQFMSPINIQGLNNRALDHEWKSGAHAFLGMSVSGFPNFFMLYGPNTNLGHNSIVYMLESQFSYILQMIKVMKKNKVKYMDIRQDEQNSYNQLIQQKLKNCVWGRDCSSWYKTEDGLNTNNWPDFTFMYRHKTRTPNIENYHVVKL